MTCIEVKLAAIIPPHKFVSKNKFSLPALSKISKCFDVLNRALNMKRVTTIESGIAVTRVMLK